jgi:uncharacterized protein
MEEMVKYITQALVDQPEDVSVASIEGHQSSILELRVAKTDLGKVIGKQGRTIGAIRTILNAASTKEKKRMVLELVE